MNTEVKDTQVDYVWDKESFSNPNEYATAICIVRGMHKFCAVWNTISQSGYLARWSRSTGSWQNLGGSFTSLIEDMCVDSNGNLYLIGDRDSNKDYIIQIYDIAANNWTSASNGYKNPISRICCDSNNNVYIGGSIGSIVQYNKSTGIWKKLDGQDFNEPIVDMCINSDNVLFVLGNTLENTYFISYWNGKTWNTINSPNLMDALAISCDNVGNIYFATSSAVMVYNLSAGVYTNLNATVPTYSGSIILFYLVFLDKTLYFCGYGYTGTASTSSFVHVYSNSTWMDITPTELDSTNIFDIASYEGKSNNILVASGLNYILDGAKLHH